MRQGPLERDINIAVNGQFLVRNLHQERSFMAMLISHSRGTCLIAWSNVEYVHCPPKELPRPKALVFSHPREKLPSHPREMHSIARASVANADLKATVHLLVGTYMVTILVGKNLPFSPDSSGSGWAATVATYCPGRMAEHLQSKSTGGFYRPEW